MKRLLIIAALLTTIGRTAAALAAGAAPITASVTRQRPEGQLRYLPRAPATSLGLSARPA